jgi:hypothetical protein
MKNFMAVAFFASVVVTGLSAAQAMPVAPLHQDPDGSITQVYGGCGLVSLPATSERPGHAGRRMLKER